MKTLPLFCLSIAFGVSLRAMPESTAPGDYSSIKVIETQSAVFPYRLLRQGCDSGTVRVIVKIDETGRLLDHLVTAYTHREFADSAVAALQAWRYEPARLDGKPVVAARELVFTFRRAGAMILALDPVELIEARATENKAGADEYRVYRPHELDGISAPTKIVEPVYPEGIVAQGGMGRVTIEFYIDEQGRVRMPAANRPDSDLLADLALNAVAQWEFTPPTSHGRPVLIRASQTFNFRPKASQP